MEFVPSLVYLVEKLIVGVGGCGPPPQGSLQMEAVERVQELHGFAGNCSEAVRKLEERSRGTERRRLYIRRNKVYAS